jgi:hypothetical protein
MPCGRSDRLRLRRPLQASATSREKMAFMVRVLATLDDLSHGNALLVLSGKGTVSSLAVGSR